MNSAGFSVIPKIVSQHAEEAAFLWLFRDHAVRAPHYDRTDLLRLDNRVEAHIDGLRITGEPGWDIVWKQAEGRPEPGELFAAGVLAFESGDPGRIDNLLTLAATKPGTGSRGSFCNRLVTDAIALKRINLLLGHASASARAIGIAAHAIRRLNPGTALEKALNDPDLALRARCHEARRRNGLCNLAALAQEAPEPLRFVVPISCVLVGSTQIAKDPGAIAELQTIAFTESRYRLRSVDMVARCLDVPTAQKWLTMLASLAGNERLAIHGMAALGDSIFVPRLLEWISSRH